MIATAIRQIFNADTGEEARERLVEVVDRLRVPAPKVAGPLEQAEEELLAFYSLPHEHWPKLRSTNPLERAWGVNADDQTYGAINDRGTPDLVAAVATNGRSGYVYASQLMSEASGVTLNVYESDGKTPIGKFVLGGTSAGTGGSR
jgi:hypothetical protein